MLYLKERRITPSVVRPKESEWMRMMAARILQRQKRRRSGSTEIMLAASSERDTEVAFIAYHYMRDELVYFILRLFFIHI